MAGDVVTLGATASNRTTAWFDHAALNPMLELWMLRILVSLNGHHKFVLDDGFSNDRLASALGFGAWLDTKVFDKRAVQIELRQKYAHAEDAASDTVWPETLEHNLERINQQLDLSHDSKLILGFVILLHAERLLDETADYLGELTSSRTYGALSVILGVPEVRVRNALKGQEILATSGMVRMARFGVESLRRRLSLLSSDLSDLANTSKLDLACSLRGTVTKADPGHLGLMDYGHIKSSLDILIPYLERVAQTDKAGVNILLYGAPGTGKSQLVRAVAKRLKRDLFEIAHEDQDGDLINGEWRLRAYSAAQKIFARRQALLVFEEIEDVFDDGDPFAGRKSTAQTSKAWINHALEQNLVPTFWLSNSISRVDPAFIRRFDVIIELPVPPKDQRLRILRESCKGVLNEASIHRVAQSEDLSPAVAARAASVIRDISDRLKPSRRTAAFEQLVSTTLRSQGHRVLAGSCTSSTQGLYRTDYVHASADLGVVAAGLKRGAAARLLFYGPPGTGKTAYAHWLADRLNRPLLIRRASDLISAWVGGTEQNLANAFHRAAQDGEILLIDEVDSFIQDRRALRTSWEVSAVNEMLTQVEAFPGIFLATTNEINSLDQAALRRFDMKIEFLFMQSAQVCAFLESCCIQLGLGSLAPGIRLRAQYLRNLTPGDFSVILRQHRIHPITTQETLIVALESECAVKESAHTAIGFV